jgi:YaiO family outer membrane protein
MMFVSVNGFRGFWRLREYSPDMKYSRTRKITCCSILMLCVSTLCVRAQVQLSCDSLFHLARNAAFDRHDYAGARALSREALQECPDYADIGDFLGRLYTWDKMPDSARQILLAVLERRPGNEETLAALTDLEYWNDRPGPALAYCEMGLAVHPGSRALLLKKARILNDLKRYREAALVADSLLKSDPKDGELRQLDLQTRSLAAENQLGLSYDYVYFDKEFNAPWQLASIEYKRQTPLGAVIGRINYANRFNTNGVQGEVDAYPHLSRMFYAYLNAGYSNNVGVFPHYRAGFSLYANLPGSWEAEAGFRYLYFSSSTWIYTASLGKYYRNFWFNLRTYLTPGGGTSQSYSLNTRYYYGGSDDYFSAGLGTGISPDDQNNNVQLDQHYSLKSNNLSVGYNHAVKKMNVFFITATWLNQEYLPGVRGNQLDVGIGYKKRW